MNHGDDGTMENLMTRAATMLLCGADENTVRAMLFADTEDTGLAFLVLAAAKLLGAAADHDDTHERL